MDLSTPRHWKVLHRGGLIKELPISNERPFAFVSESRKEHNFVKHKQSGQYCHPTTQKYSKTKRGDKEVIKKT